MNWELDNYYGRQPMTGHIYGEAGSWTIPSGARVRGNGPHRIEISMDGGVHWRELRTDAEVLLGYDQFVTVEPNAAGGDDSQAINAAMNLAASRVFDPAAVTYTGGVRLHSTNQDGEPVFSWEPHLQTWSAQANESGVRVPGGNTVITGCSTQAGHSFVPGARFVGYSSEPDASYAPYASAAEFEAAVGMATRPERREIPSTEELLATMDAELRRVAEYRPQLSPEPTGDSMRWHGPSGDPDLPSSPA